MFVGRVVGNVWSTVKWPAIEGLKLLAVQPYHLRDIDRETDQSEAASRPEGHCSDLVICADVLDAGIGDEVVIAYGHAARVALHERLGQGEKPSFAVDAAVVAIVDRMQVDRSQATES